MKGKLYGVGTGPGDPELITLKAVRIIVLCPVIAVPISGGGERVALNIVCQVIPSVEDKRLLELDMPMTRDEAILRAAHQKAAEEIIRVLDRGENVAFLTLGDPTVYSTYIYLHRLVRERGYNAEIIPGVPSFCAASARVGDCLVETGQPLHILPGAYGDISAQLALNGTKVIMKSGKSLDKLRDVLSDGAHHSIKIVENCGMPGERIYETLEQAETRPGYFSVVIVKD